MFLYVCKSTEINKKRITSGYVCTVVTEEDNVDRRDCVEERVKTCNGRTIIISF